MPKLNYDNPPAHPVLFKILEDLESEAMKQCATENIARKALLTRVVARTEALMHGMYQAETERLRSDGQAYGKAVALPPGRTPYSKFVVPTTPGRSPSGKFDIPVTPRFKGNGGAMLHPSGPPVAWDFPCEAALANLRRCTTGDHASDGTYSTNVDVTSYLVNDAIALKGKVEHELPSIELDVAVMKDANDFAVDNSFLRPLNNQSLPQLPVSSMHTKTNVDKHNSFTSNSCEGKVGNKDGANGNHHNLTMNTADLARTPESDDFVLLPTWEHQEKNIEGIWSPKRPKHTVWELDSEVSKDGGSVCSSPSHAVSPQLGRSESVASIGDDATLYIDTDLEGGVHCQNLIMRPTSAKCILWDTLKSLAVLYDLIFIPLSAFALPETTILMINDAIVSGIWVLDILVSFLRGYIDEHGVVQMEARKVAVKYIRTWFFFDSLVVAIDISLITMVQAISMHGILSLLPMLRLIRIMKLPSLLSVILEYMKLKTNTDKWTFVWRIVRLLSVFLVLNHFMACGWYAVGRLGQRSDGLTSISNTFTLQEHWPDQHFDDAADFGYRYATSFHWSLTQLTPASMEVTPTNSVERSYNVCIIVFGFLMFSTFVSMMTQSILMLQQASEAEKRALRDLRRFVADNNLSAETIGKVMVLLHESKGSMRSKRLHEVDVDALKMLPHTLRQQIRFEMYSPTLQRHPLMDEIYVAHYTCFKSLCHNALSEKSVERGETLFSFGMQGTGMYFVIDGTLHYHIGFNQTIDEVVLCNQAGDSRLCEGALWVQWSHRGRMVGERRCYVILFEASQFGTICSHSLLLRQLQVYAKMFARLALKSHERALDVKDTWCDDTNAKLLVAVSFNLAVWLPEDAAAHVDLGVAFTAWRDWAVANRNQRPLRFLQRGATTKSVLSDLWKTRSHSSISFDSSMQAVAKPRRWRDIASAGSSHSSIFGVFRHRAQ